ncbi:MAG: ABC transporter permease [Promethearchaeota archaeon]
MNTSKPTSVETGADPSGVPMEKKVDIKNSLLLQLESMRPMFVLFSKTMSDLFSVKKFIIVLALMSVFPLLLALGSIAGTNFGALPIYSASMKLNFSVLTNFYLWTLGLILALIVGGNSAGLIADEVDRGTMLILVSKPIGRFQIFLGKYLAVFSFGALLSFLSIFITAWMLVLLTSGNLVHFIGMLPFLMIVFSYSLFIEAIFLTISMALSSIMSRGRKVVIIIMFLVIMTYFGFLIIRTLFYQYYEVFSLYYFDIGYHLANVFVFIIDITNVLPSSSLWQQEFDLATGVFKGTSIDSSQGIELGGLELVGYVPPIISLLLWSGLTALLLIFGLIKLKTKEISN